MTVKEAVKNINRYKRQAIIMRRVSSENDETSFVSAMQNREFVQNVSTVEELRPDLDALKIETNCFVMPFTGSIVITV